MEKKLKMLLVITYIFLSLGKHKIKHFNIYIYIFVLLKQIMSLILLSFTDFQPVVEYEPKFLTVTFLTKFFFHSLLLTTTPNNIYLLFSKNIYIVINVIF